MPKVSVIVTAYNIEGYVRESLDSVVNQTLKDIEIIVVDDGSTDGTPEVIQEYAARDSRVRPILFEENTIGGVASAANAGIEASTGDYIGFADGDDLYESTMFEQLYEAAVAADADLAMCRYMLLDEADGQLHEPAETGRWLPYSDQTVIELNKDRKRELLQFISVPWRKIYRRDLVERTNLRFPVGDFFFEDNPFHWAAVLSGNRIVMLPERLCKHRVSRLGQTMSTIDRRLLRIFEHHDIIADWLRSFGLYEQYKLDLLIWAASQLAWVSERADDALARELFDIWRPIADQYDKRVISKLAVEGGRGRIYRMLIAAKTADYDRFAREVGPEHVRNVALASSRPQSRLLALISHGFFHLRHSGLISTGKITMRYLFDKLKPRLKGLDQSGASGEITNDDLMTALAILQRDVRALKAEVSQLKEQSAGGKSTTASKAASDQGSGDGA